MTTASCPAPGAAPGRLRRILGLHLPSALAEVERLTAGDLAAVPRDLTWSFSPAVLALACYHLGDTASATRVRELLEPYADRNIAIGRYGVFCLGPAAYFLGLLDLTLDRPEQARCSFEQAAVLAAKVEARPMVAMSHEGQARALLALDRPGDHPQARVLLGEAVTIAQDLGIHGLGERAAALLKELAAPAVPVWPAG